MEAVLETERRNLVKERQSIFRLSLRKQMAAMAGGTIDLCCPNWLVKMLNQGVEDVC
jgi:hypothetical protein